MPEATAPRDTHPLEMIEAMTRCAHDLGIAAAGIAQRAADDDTAGFLAASAEFRHCFFAVRMGVRLAQAERAAARAAAPAERLERGPPERESAERERAEATEVPERDDWRDDARLEAERDREGDYEPVSLPQFLRTLRGVAVRADQQRDDLPAHVRDTILPTLQGLLRQAKAPPEGGASAVAVLNRPPAIPAARSRLLTSTFTPCVPLLRPPAARRRDSS